MDHGHGHGHHGHGHLGHHGHGHHNDNVNPFISNQESHRDGRVQRGEECYCVPAVSNLTQPFLVVFLTSQFQYL